MGSPILVVDAEPVVRSVIKAILEREGYDVMPVADPKAALEIVKVKQPVLIITNVNLPGMSGHDAMLMFRESCPDVPVLMVSGIPDCEVVQHWRAEEGFDIFPKPFRSEQLAKKVREVLGE
jgi:CheY-like chemotaxis protein